MKNTKLPADRATEREAVVEKQDGKKKLSKLKALSIIWTLLSFCIYVALDVNKIHKNGWTAVNVIVTVFLGLQILLFLIFTAIGAKSKEESKKQKTTLKWVKKTKKLTLKLTTFVTSVLMIVNVEKVSFADVIAVIVAVISLLLVLFSVYRAIRKQVKSNKKAKAKQEKNNK
ncbi:MAG: hypothetical protein K2O95_06990 [Clostridia bacterium]|nr:hypothetical protein [Clostridia bacterium]